MNFDFVKEDFAGGVSYRVVNPQIRDQFLCVVNRMYGVRNDLQYKFPGAQPCSVMRDNLDKLSREHYVVAEKTDGTRYLMLVTRNRESGSNFVVMIDRSLTMWIIEMDFADVVFASCTLFDGELVHNGLENRWMYQIFDLIGSGSEFRPRDTYVQRLKNARTIIDRYHRNKPQSDPFRMIVKRFYPTYEIDRLLPSVQMHEGCRTDGLIFTPVNQGVKPYRNRAMFKWKQQDDHTIDCLLRYNADQARRLRDSAQLNAVANVVAVGTAAEQAAVQAIGKTKRKRKSGEQMMAEAEAQLGDKRDAKRVKTRPVGKTAQPRTESADCEATEAEQDDDYDASKAPQRRTVNWTAHVRSGGYSEGLALLFEQQQQRCEAKQQAALVIEVDSASNDEDEESASPVSSSGSSVVSSRPQTPDAGQRRDNCASQDQILRHGEDDEVDFASRKDVASMSIGSNTQQHSISPSRIEFDSFEFWLNDSRNTLVRHKSVDPALNRAFLLEHGLDIVAGNEPIVECRYDLSVHNWRILWIRKDRTSPNTEFTVQKTAENIEENITLEEIAHVARNNRPPSSVRRSGAHSRSHAMQQQRAPRVVPHNPFVASNNAFAQQQPVHGYAPGPEPTAWQTPPQPPVQQPLQRFQQPAQSFGPSPAYASVLASGALPHMMTQQQTVAPRSPSYMHPDRLAAMMPAGHNAADAALVPPPYAQHPRQLMPPPAGYDQAYVPSPDRQRHYSPSQSYDWPASSSQQQQRSRRRAHYERQRDVQPTHHQPMSRLRSPSYSPPPHSESISAHTDDDVEEYDPTNPGMHTTLPTTIGAATCGSKVAPVQQPDVGALLSQLSASLKNNPDSALHKALSSADAATSVQ